jgi:PAS domain S-box-containing protein
VICDLVRDLVKVLPEPSLLLSGDGQILAANPPFLQKVGMVNEALQGKALTDLVLNPPEKVTQYLYACAGSRQMVWGSLTWPMADGQASDYRCEGAVVRPWSPDEPALLLLRLIVRKSDDERFTLLNQKIAELGREIHERQQVEAALRHSEERLRLATEAGRIGIFDHDLRTQQTQFSPFYYEITQLPPDEQPTRQSWLTRVHPDDRMWVEQTLSRAIETGQGYHYEYRILWPDGAIRWLEVSSVVTPDENGRPLRIIGAIQDVTERKQAEAALRESEQKFAKVFHAGPLVITITKLADGRLVEVNETFVRMTGYSRGEVLGHTPTELGFWVEPAQRAEGLAQLRAGQFKHNTEARFRMKDGSERTCLISAELIEITEEPCVVTVINDISERKQAEFALRAGEANYRALFEGASDGIFIADEQGYYVDANASACRMSGYDRDELLGKHLHNLTPPADWPRLDVDRFVLAPGGSQISEWALLRKDGTTLPIEVSAKQLPDGRWQAFVRDITQRKRIEAALRELNATLEQQVAERTAELARSNRELDQFAYVASHDLRSPLRAIDHLASWISEDAAHLLPESSQEHLVKLRGRIKRMDNLLNDLLAYSRAGRHHHPVELVETSVLVENVVDLLSPLEGFVVTVADPLPTLLTERVPLETIFRNLIGNAIKHHDRPQEGRVIISAQHQSNFVEFTVADNGPGIDVAFHERIFEIFQTLHPRDQVEGSGVGLSLVRRLVESYGGRVWLESSRGRGATFRFTWPQ